MPISSTGHCQLYWEIGVCLDGVMAAITNSPLSLLLDSQNTLITGVKIAVQRKL